MTKESAKRASEILKETDSLLEYKKLLEDRDYKQVAHFVMVQHYGDNPRSVVFSPKYNQNFLPVVKAIIEELEIELKELT